MDGFGGTGWGMGGERQSSRDARASDVVSAAQRLYETGDKGGRRDGQ